MDTFLILHEDILPNPAEVDWLNNEQVLSEPSNDLHFAIRAIVEELEYHHLIFQKMENHP